MQKDGLKGIRVIDMTDAKGRLCTKLFADLGADVVKVEPHGGDPGRHEGPFFKDNGGRTWSLPFEYYHALKRSVILDLSSPEGQAQFKELVGGADILVESLQLGSLTRWGLDYAALRDINPGLVMTSISGFGQRGPYRDYQVTDLISFAMGGIMYLSGEPTKPPVAAPWEQSYALGSFHAAYLTLVALYHRLRTGKGQHVDLSLHEVQASLYNCITRYSYARYILGRNGSQTSLVPGRVYPCRDGYINIAVFTVDQWRSFLDWLGNPPEVSGPEWEDSVFRLDNVDLINALVISVTGQLTQEEVVEQLQKRRIPCLPTYSPGEFVQCPQIRDRGFFQEVEHPAWGRFLTPGLPFRFGSCTFAPYKPSPNVGEHTQEVLQEFKGTPFGSHNSQSPSKTPDLPLSQVRVVDFTYVWAGPFATRYLADYGAQVFKIESHRRPDGRVRASVVDPRAQGLATANFTEINRNKMGITLNMGHPGGRELAKDLICASDVVVENFSYRVMGSWGLDYQSLAKVRDGLIMLSTQGLGQTGPYRDYLTYGPNLLPFTGMSYLWRHPDDEAPVGSVIPYPDYVAAIAGAVAIMVALIQRERTGKGQHIDLAQVEATAYLMGPAYLEYTVNHREPKPLGNSSPTHGPKGCYRCKGEDRWCVVEVVTQEQWEAFCKVLGNPPWAQQSQFSDPEGRAKHAAELDQRVEEWTSQRTPHQVMGVLQRAGVPAGVVQNAEDLYMDPQLRALGFIVPLELPGVGQVESPGVIGRLSETAGAIRRIAPELGQDNETVFSELLGSSQETLHRLMAEGVVA